MEGFTSDTPVSAIAASWAQMAIKKARGSLMNLTTVYDCIGSKLGSFGIPPGVLMMGYATGDIPVPWTEAQFSQHPGAIRVDQWPSQVPAGETADVIDVENGAVTIPEVPGRLVVLRNSFREARRPGQRWPAVYVEESEVTPVANALIAAGINADVPLFLTKPMPEHAAIDKLNNTGGPFPYIGIQYEFNPDYDVSIVDTTWLNHVAQTQPDTTKTPSLQTGWKFCIKCQGLFFGAGEARSACPRGGQHDGSHSHDYVLGFDK